jgi:TonB family protein
MKRQLTPFALVATVCLATLSPSVAASESGSMSRRMFAAMLFEYLGAKRVPCPESVAGMDSGDEAECAEVSLAWRPLKKKTRSFTRKHLPDDYFGEVPWLRAKGYFTRHVTTSDGPLRLVFDAEAGWLALMPGHPCFDSARAEALNLHVADGEIVSLPEATLRVRPDYPEAARVEKANGFVVLEAVIFEDGSVGHVCVIHESRQGLGFGEAAKQAMSGYRFKPATKDGVPVNTTVVNTIRWEIH